LYLQRTPKALCRDLIAATLYFSALGAGAFSLSLPRWAIHFSQHFDRFVKKQRACSIGIRLAAAKHLTRNQLSGARKVTRRTIWQTFVNSDNRF
jgi:hypothetical protein